jgi:hypothetical protein
MESKLEVLHLDYLILNYTVSNVGLSINSTFRQSRSVSENMTIPFYNKAKIMENGIPVTISPTRSQVLKFSGPNGDVFTKKPIKVDSPGGDEVFGSFESTVDIFISRYFKQIIFKSIWTLRLYLKNQFYIKRILLLDLNLEKARVLTLDLNG